MARGTTPVSIDPEPTAPAVAPAEAPLDVAVDEAAFRAWASEKLAPTVVLDGAYGADLRLAFACSLGAPEAVATFERRFFDEVRDVLTNMNLLHLEDELRQLLRLKLFFPANHASPAISEYAGRGELRVWLRVIVIRMALNLRRSTKRERPLDERARDVDPIVMKDPELLYLHEQSKADFVAAFGEAVATLTSQERTMLRLHYVDRLSIDPLGALYRTHRATAARRLQRIRSTLLERTRCILGERLRLASTELDSLMRLIENTVDLELPEMLLKP